MGRITNINRTGHDVKTESDVYTYNLESHSQFTVIFKNIQTVQFYYQLYLKEEKKYIIGKNF